jgi:hypothetical protein
LGIILIITKIIIGLHQLGKHFNSKASKTLNIELKFNFCIKAIAKELNGEEVPFDFFNHSRVSSSHSNTNRDLEVGRNKDDKNNNDSSARN